MKNLFFLLITVPLILSIEIPNWDWDNWRNWNWSNWDWSNWDWNSLDWNSNWDWESLKNKSNFVIPENIKKILKLPEEQMKEVFKKLTGNLTALQNLVQNELAKGSEIAQEKLKELFEKTTETLNILSLKLCNETNNNDYKICRDNKKDSMSKIIEIVQNHLGNCSSIVDEISKLSGDPEMNLKHILSLVNSITENPDAIANGKSQVIFDALNCLQDKFEDYWKIIAEKLGDNETSIRLEVKNLLMNSMSNFGNIIKNEEIDGYIQKANEITGLISDPKAKELYKNIFKNLKSYNNFSEGFYNISADLGLNLLIKPDHFDAEVNAELKWFNDTNKGIKIGLYSNFMFNTTDAQSLQAVVFDSPLVSLKGSKKTEGGTSNTFVGITLYDSEGNEIQVKDFNIEEYKPEILFKKSLYKGMTNCLYYNEAGDSIENTGINSNITIKDGEEYIKCIPNHLSSFTVGSYQQARISPEEKTKEEEGNEKKPEDDNKTVIIVIVCVVVGLALLVGGYFLYRYCKRKNNQF
mgnify:FL=1